MFCFDRAEVRTIAALVNLASNQYPAMLSSFGLKESRQQLPTPSFDWRTPTPCKLLSLWSSFFAVLQVYFLHVCFFSRSCGWLPETSYSTGVFTFWIRKKLPKLRLGSSFCLESWRAPETAGREQIHLYDVFLMCTCIWELVPIQWTPNEHPV